MVNTVPQLNKHTHPFQSGENVEQSSQAVQVRDGQKLLGVLEGWGTNWSCYHHDKSETLYFLGVRLCATVGGKMYQRKVFGKTLLHPVCPVVTTVSNNSNCYSLISIYYVLGTESSQSGYYAYFIDKETETQ